MATCCSISCPQPLPVTIINTVEYTGAGFIYPHIEYTPDPGTISGTISVQAQGDGGVVPERVNAVVWFEDTADDEFSGIPTYNPPTVPGVQQFELMTNAVGLGEVSVQYSGTVKSWRVYASIGGNVCEDYVTMELGASA